jgi:hypothetical protein
MTPRTSRLGRNPVVFWSFALLVGLSGTAAKADALYTVTNLGSSGVTLTTASGSTIGVASDGAISATSAGNIPQLALTQLASASNGQASYSFATTADTSLTEGHGPLANFPVSPQSMDISSSVFGTAYVEAVMNANGYAALVLDAPVTSFTQLGYSLVYGAQENSGGTLGQTVTITTTPPNDSQQPNNSITIAGVNSLDQVLIGTAFSNVANDSLVYNAGTKSLTDLDQLPQLYGSFSNLSALAIDNMGQILVAALNDQTMQEETLLLTPSGEPIVTTPEPSTCIGWVVVVGASWFAAKRAGRKRA